MKIEGIDIYWVRLPLAFVWKTSYGDQLYTDTILVRMESGGQYAWGESCPPYMPGYSAEHTVATFYTLREHLAPRIIGQDLDSAQALLDRISDIKGNQFARAALEITWWVLEAKGRGVPLHVALGGKGDRVAVGADFGIQDSVDILLEKIQGAIDQGFPRISSNSGRAGTSTWWRRCGPRSRASPSTSTAMPPTHRPIPTFSASWTAITWP